MSSKHCVLQKGGVADRAAGIGGSDVAAIMGCSRFGRTIHDAYLEKIGEGRPFEVTEAMNIGTALEASIAKLYGDVIAPLGEVVARFEGVEGFRYVSSRLPYMMAHLDGVVYAAADYEALGEGEMAIDMPSARGLEIKNVGIGSAKYFGPSGTDEVPTDYLLQCQHYMYVTGLTSFDLVALIGGNSLRVYEIERNEDLIAKIVAACDSFWNDHVVPRVAPPIPETPDGSRAADMIYRHAIKDLEAENNERVDELCRRWLAASKQIAESEEARECIAAAIKTHMKEATLIVGPDYTVKYGVPGTRTTTDWKKVAAALNPPVSLVAHNTKITINEKRPFTIKPRFEDSNGNE